MLGPQAPSDSGFLVIVWMQVERPLALVEELSHKLSRPTAQDRVEADTGEQYQANDLDRRSTLLGSRVQCVGSHGGEAPVDQVANGQTEPDDGDAENSCYPPAVKTGQNSKGGGVGGGSCQEEGQSGAGREPASQENGNQRCSSRCADIRRQAKKREQRDLPKVSDPRQRLPGEEWVDQGGDTHAEQNPGRRVVNHFHQPDVQGGAQACGEG